LAWANDNKTLFYGQLDEAHRPYQAFKHVLGTKVEQDTKLYEEKDDRFFLEISKSRNARLIFISVESELSSEVRFLEADQPGQELRLIRPRENDLLYNVENHDDRFFIVTNEKAKNFKIVEAPLLHQERKIGRTSFLTILTSKSIVWMPSRMIWPFPSDGKVCRPFGSMISKQKNRTK
jgi:oligopeptidase B